MAAVIWEKVEASASTGVYPFRVYRAAVPGGWLVLTDLSMGEHPGISVTFMPDPDHTWQ